MSLLKIKFWPVLIGALVLVNFVLVASVLGFNLFGSNNKEISPVSINKDLEELKNKNLKNFQELADYFTDLAEKNGGEYAYQVLKVAPVPPNIDMHLLGHKVGDVLYQQEGVKGMYKCTQDFRNACSHTIVVGMLFDKGEAALEEIVDTCRHAPGGQGAYTMCFHGLGHGVLAYNGYSLEKTVKMCQEIGTEEFNNSEFPKCIGGAIMEIIGGGFHDKEAWNRERPKYLTESNPLMPCSSDIIPLEAKYDCYAYLTPHLFTTAGANFANPDPSTFGKAFSFCDKIPTKDTRSRQGCFGGFGKEFIVLVKQRDIRNMDKFTDAELKTVHEWCKLAKKKDGIEFCINSTVSSLFWGGENDPKVSVNFCSLAEPSFQTSCFRVLNGNAFQYLKSKETLDSFCNLLPEAYKKECLKI